MSELLTVDEVAVIMKVTPYTVRRWLRRNILRGVKIAGGEWRIPRTEIDNAVSVDRAA